MQISVVIPTYNRRKMVRRAIDSVLEQTTKAFEIAVIDDGSTDGTGSELESYGNAIQYVYQRNGGVSAARNRGYEVTTGEFVAFLDSDDQWLPRMVEVLTEALRRYPDVVAVAANGIIRTTGGPANGEESIFGARQTRIAKDQIVRLGGVSSALLQPVTSGILIRRSVLQQIGTFDVKVREYEDFDLWSRISTRGSWAFCGEPLWIHYRDIVDQTNVSSQYWERPLDAYISLFRSHERLLHSGARNWSETVELRRAVGNYRCIMGALRSDQGLPGGAASVVRSVLDWPSPRRFARAAAMLAGWRPASIREHSQRLRASRAAPAT